MGIGCVSTRTPTEASQQLGPHGPVRLYRSVSRASSSSATIPVGPRRLAQRHRAADRDDRPIGQFQQPIIELENGAPVGPAAIRRAQCTDCTARLAVEPARSGAGGRAGATALGHQNEDHLPVLGKSGSTPKAADRFNAMGQPDFYSKRVAVEVAQPVLNN